MSQSIKKEQVRSVYSGKAGRCCCGCSGKHYYNSKFIGEAEKDRGYKIDKEEINDNMISRAVNILNNAICEGKAEIEDTMVCYEIQDRLYIAYLRTPLQEEV